MALSAEDNIEAVRAGIDAWNRRDWDGALEGAARDIELDTSNQTEWRGVYRGRDQVKRMWQTFTEPWAAAGLSE